MLKFKRHMEVAKQRKKQNKAYGVEMNTNCEISYKRQNEEPEECEIDGNIFDIKEGIEKIVSTLATIGGFREKEIYEYLLEEQIKKDKKRINTRKAGGN